MLPTAPRATCLTSSASGPEPQRRGDAAVRGCHAVLPSSRLRQKGQGGRPVTARWARRPRLRRRSEAWTYLTSERGSRDRSSKTAASLPSRLSGGRSRAAAQIRLEENFRGTGHICAQAANAPDRARLGKTLYTGKPEGAPIESSQFTQQRTGSVRDRHGDRRTAGRRHYLGRGRHSLL